MSVATLALWIPAAILVGWQWLPLLIYGYRPHVPPGLAVIAPIASEVRIPFYLLSLEKISFYQSFNSYGWILLNLDLVRFLFLQAATSVPVLCFIAGDERLRAALLGRMRRHYALLQPERAKRYNRA